MLNIAEKQNWEHRDQTEHNQKEKRDLKKMKEKLRDMKSNSKSLNIGLIGVPEGYTEITEKSVLKEITAENLIRA